VGGSTRTVVAAASAKARFRLETSSPQERKRSSGNFASPRSKTSSTAAGNVGASPTADGIGAVACAAASLANVSAT
jgi:hypothetical protein